MHIINIENFATQFTLLMRQIVLINYLQRILKSSLHRRILLSTLLRICAPQRELFKSSAVLTVLSITSISLCWEGLRTSRLSHFLRAFYKEFAIKNPGRIHADVFFFPLFIFFYTFVVDRKKHRYFHFLLNASYGK